MTTSRELAHDERAVLAHAIPFIVWVLMMHVPGLDGAMGYALRSVLGVATLMVMRPWRWYRSTLPKHLAASLGVGAGVFALWVLPESPVLDAQLGAGREWYARYAIGLWPPGALPVVEDPSPYAPEICGWALTLTRILGSAFVIAVIEEFFWRGFVYRLIIGRSFTQVDIGRLHWPAMLIAACLFGVEHQRWLAGIAAGLAYTLLMVRTRDIWAAITAHVTTNLLLGVHVVLTRSYQFW